MMPDSNSLSPQDLERLSAFLDGDLSPREAEALKARLRQETQLRRRLEELRHTVAQLNDLPPIRTPRNFTLTTEMAGIRPQRRPLFNFFRFASAVAAAALIFVVGLDLAVASGQLPFLSSAAGEMAEETALLNDAAQRAGAPEEAEADFGEPMAMQATEELEEQSLGEADAEQEAPVEEGDGAADCADCPTPAVESAEMPPATEGRQGLSVEATATAKWQQTGQDEGTEDQVDTGISELPVDGRVFWTPIRLVEVSLASLVLVLVVATLVLRRQQP